MLLPVRLQHVTPSSYPSVASRFAAVPTREADTAPETPPDAARDKAFVVYQHRRAGAWWEPLPNSLRLLAGSDPRLQQGNS